jgi:predicted nucleic acid-binding protein
MPVLDAAVVVAYLSGGEPAERAEERIAAERRALYAPHLIDAEVGHALRAMVLRRSLDPHDAKASLADLAELPILRCPHTWLLDRAWELRGSFSFYDALYLALAQELEVALLTLDARMARAAAKLAVEVELL